MAVVPRQREPGTGGPLFLIFGLRTKAVLLGLVFITCPVCGQHDTLQLARETTKLSLFFIPLVPIRTRHVLYCPDPACVGRSKIADSEARGLLVRGLASPLV